MLLPWDVLVIATISQVVLYLIYISRIVIYNGAEKTISEIDKQVNTKKRYIESLSIECESLLLVETNELVRNALVDLKEVIRYSDPMSPKELSVIEDEILYKVSELTNSFSSLTEEQKVESIKNIKNQMLVRNMKCKIFK